jgi:hypothetical protein
MLSARWKNDGQVAVHASRLKKHPIDITGKLRTTKTGIAPNDASSREKVVLLFKSCNRIHRFVKICPARDTSPGTLSYCIRQEHLPTCTSKLSNEKEMYSICSRGINIRFAGYLFCSRKKDEPLHKKCVIEQYLLFVRGTNSQYIIKD